MTELATNLIFKDESGSQTDATCNAFRDTWPSGPSAEALV